MSNTPINPNFNPNSNPGRLATDRYDFESHIQGTKFRHNATQIDLFPNVSIDGYNKSTVQEAISAIADALSPPVIPDATTSQKGILQLIGDLGGTATNVIVTQIQGKPISTLSPTLNDVLTWNGSSWSASPAVNSFSANGDLAGTSTLQTVVNLTGAAGILTASCDTIKFIASVTNPTVTQNITSSAPGATLSLIAQTSSLASAKGGDVIISGGSPGSGGLKGGVKIQLDSSANNLLQAVEVASGRRVLSLVNSADLTTADMPANTGDMVIYVRNAVTAPNAAGIPVNGTIMYSDAGKMRIKQTDGADFIIGDIPNPSTWGVLTTSPPNGQTITYRLGAITTTASPGNIFSFTLLDKVTTKIDVIFIGKQDNASESSQFNLSMGYVRQDSAATPVKDIGTLTSADPRFSSPVAAAWTVPTISRVGNVVTIYTGANITTTIYWTAIIQLTLCQSFT